MNEYVKTLVALAELVPDPIEKVELNLKARGLVCHQVRQPG